MAQVYVGAGSNIEPRTHLRLAVQALTQHFGALSCSAVYASAPIGVEGPEFLNMVVGLQTQASPQSVASLLKAMEQQQSRQPRALDLDFLLYDDHVIDSPELRLPRDDIERFAFVLRPLAELAPTQRHPVKRLSYAELWAAFPAHTQPLRQVELAWL